MQEQICELRKSYFPIDLGNGYQVISVSSYEEHRKFIRENYGKVFRGSSYSRENPRLIYAEEREPANMELAEKIGFKHLHRETLFFCFEGEPIGWLSGETADFMTFYMRNTGIFPEHQGKGIYSSFLKKFLCYLKEIGYERVSSQHKANNNKILIPKLRAGFVIGGLDFDERYGPLVRLLYFFESDRWNSFDAQYGV